MVTRTSDLSLEERIALYDRVLELRQRRRLTYEQIRERIQRCNRVQLSLSCIGNWINGIHQPLGNFNKFDGKPSPELANIIGAILSDGDRRKYQHSLRLRVKDYEYDCEFGRCLAKVLGREKPYKPFWSRSEGRFVVEVCSILLYKFLDRPWWELTPYVEHCKNCVAAFLRAFFDGEGSITGVTLVLYNTDKEILLFVQKCLQKYFGIATAGPYRSKKAGLFRDSRSGKIYRSEKTCHRLRVCSESLPLFYQHIGFTIERKQHRLVVAVRRQVASYFPLDRRANA